jgi:hypothetical protein
MQGACSVIDTACIINFRTTSKSENHMQNGDAMQKIKNACRVIDTVCKIDERFERPWQPLKGISIKNYPELSYPTSKKIAKNVRAYGDIDTTCTILRSKIDHISENPKQNSKRL